MDKQESIDDKQILNKWYRFAANQPGFVGSALALLRGRRGITSQHQQNDFGVGDENFLRLQAMSLPRSQSFANDAHRIAQTCGLANPLAFVQSMMLWRNLEAAEAQTEKEEFYQAAFDEDSELDTPDEEQ